MIPHEMWWCTLEDIKICTREAGTWHSMRMDKESWKGSTKNEIHETKKGKSMA